MADIGRLLDLLWQDYAALNRQVRAVRGLLEQEGETVVNDHIALRTFDDSRVGIDALAGAFVAGGYQACGEYDFVQKKLFARHYEHADPALPRVFISQLKLAECSAGLRQIVAELLEQVPADLLGRWDFPVSGRTWNVDYRTYEALADESEYAGWVAAFGFRANHFTVLVNALKTFDGLAALNAFIKQSGYPLNDGGGEIKGSPQSLLEQSSTLADQVPVDFTDGPHTIPACYYEFARRYPTADGKLFYGFVASSADKIFESTDRR